MEDLTALINMVSNWESGDSKASKLCFMAENKKDNLMAIFDAFVDCYDVSINRLDGVGGMFCEVTLTRLRPNL